MEQLNSSLSSAPSNLATNNNPFRRISAFETLTSSNSSVRSLDLPPALEELPAYTEEISPAYEEPENEANEPTLSLCLYQIARKVQVITPATHAALNRPRYHISTRSTTGIFSKKPGYTLTKLPSSAEAASLDSKGEDVATIRFDRNGELPWMPRATVTHHTAQTESARYPIQAPNFSDWQVQRDGQVYTWILAQNPTSLVLMQQDSMDTVARFTYSKLGTTATRGAEVGKMDFFGGDETIAQPWVEFVLATAVAVMQHWKSMGKNFKNDDMPTSASIVGCGLARNELERIRRASQTSTVL